MQKLTTEQIEGILDLAELEAELGRRSLRSFVEMAWQIVEPGTPYVGNWHIDAICEHLEAVTSGQIENLLINVPPGCSKSLLTSVFWPSWEWAKDPALRWFFASYDQRLSTRDAMKTRLVIESEWYRERWPELQIRHDQGEKTYYETTETGWRLSTSVGGHGTGQHPDRIVADDPHKVKGAESELERQSVLDWWDQTMATRGVSRGARRVVIMQRLHENDLSGHILEKGGYVHICLPMRYEPKRMVETPLGWIDPRTEEGELLSPKQFPEDKVKKVEMSMGSYGTAGQFQQRPSPAEGGTFKRHWWRYWKPKGVDLPPVSVKVPDGDSYVMVNIDAIELPTLEELLQSWDMTFKDEKSAKSGKVDWVVGQTWGRKGADKFLLDQDRRKLDFPATCLAVISAADKWPGAQGRLIEDKANGPAVIATLRHKVSGLIAITPDGGKVARANACSPQVEAGNVYLPHPLLYAWVNDFVEEFATFPNGTHDDQVDSGSQALNRFERVTYDVVMPVSILKTDPRVDFIPPAKSNKALPELIRTSRKGIGW